MEDLPAQVRAKAKTTKATGGTKFKVEPAVKPPAAKALPEIDSSDNYAGLAYDVVNSRDLATTGATASGAAGDVVTVKIGVKNGVSTLDSYRTGGEPSARFTLTVPDGTQVVDVGEHCAAQWKEANGNNRWDSVPGKRFYQCWNDVPLFKPGAAYTTTFPAARAASAAACRRPAP